MILKRFGPIPCKDWEEVKLELAHAEKSCSENFTPRTWGLLIQVQAYLDVNGFQFEAIALDKAGQLAIRQVLAEQELLKVGNEILP